MPRRDVAAAPVRSSDEAWTAIGDLVRVTLTRSPSITAADVDAVLTAAAIVGRPLIAGGHLDTHPLVLVAGDLQLTIATVSGSKAFTTEENTNPVPGAAGATEWTLYLPTPDPLGALVKRTVTGVTHLSAEPAPGSSASESSAAGSRRPSLRIDPAAIKMRTS